MLKGILSCLITAGWPILFVILAFPGLQVLDNVQSASFDSLSRRRTRHIRIFWHEG